MSLATADSGAGEVSRFPVRLRTPMTLALLVLAAWWAYPRLLAAWKLHGGAKALADYGLCMVGPVGPSLLRDNPDQFARLVRRRIVAARPDETPFADCSGPAQTLTDDVGVERAHLAQAQDFVDYGGRAADRASQGSTGEISANDLRITTRRLAEYAQQAWPFVRGGYTKLVRSSSLAREAVQIADLPRPAVGQGIPGWRPRYRAVRVLDDGYLLAVGSGANLTVHRGDERGLVWRPTATNAAGAQELGERCPADDARSFIFALSQDDRYLLVRSQGSDGAPSDARLARADQAVFAAACDAQALVVGLSTEGGTRAAARVCRHRGSCTNLPLPPLPSYSGKSGVTMDLARVDGVTLLAVARYGIVRVSSTRDDGRSWTPFIVAFDRAEYPNLETHVAVADRLLALGSTVLLYGGAARPGETYPVLVSDNAGVSWRTP